MEISVVIARVPNVHSFCSIIEYLDTKIKNISGVGNSLVIESTTAAGGVAIFDDCFCEFLVEFISKSTRHTFPGQDDDNDDGIVTVVPSSLLYHT